jgi:DegV family protein with EDD domain
MTHPIALVTDSTCDIPLSWREQYEIIVVPLTVVFGSEQFLDGVELTSEAFYARLGQDRTHPTTSQPTPKAFLEAFQHAVARGAQEVIVFTISSQMSGTIESARRAAAEAPVPVHVVDSCNNSMGLGWQVIAAARIREAGGGLADMLAAAQRVRQRMVYFVTLDTIEYLAKGGRISDAVRFVNSVLQIKPLIFVKPESGTVGASLPARSRKAGVDGLFKEFFKRLNPGSNDRLHLTILHNAALEEAEGLATRVRAEYNPDELFITITSPVLGAHTGPRALALLGYIE